MAKVLDCALEVSEFELQLSYYVHFWTNTFIKGFKHLISRAITAIFLLDGFGIR